MVGEGREAAVLSIVQATERVLPATTNRESRRTAGKECQTCRPFPDNKRKCACEVDEGRRTLEEPADVSGRATSRPNKSLTEQATNETLTLIADARTSGQDARVYDTFSADDIVTEQLEDNLQGQEGTRRCFQKQRAEDCPAGQEVTIEELSEAGPKRDHQKQMLWTSGRVAESETCLKWFNRAVVQKAWQQQINRKQMQPKNKTQRFQTSRQVKAGQEPGAQSHLVWRIKNKREDNSEKNDNRGGPEPPTDLLAILRLQDEEWVQKIKDDGEERATLSEEKRRQPVYAARLNGVEVTAFLDSGATRSFVDPDMIPSLTLTPEKLEKKVKVICANGSEIVVEFVCRGVPADISDLKCSTDLLVARVGQPVLLGYDYMRKSQMYWHPQSGRIWFLGEDSEQSEGWEKLFQTTPKFLGKLTPPLTSDTLTWGKRKQPYNAAAKERSRMSKKPFAVALDSHGEEESQIVEEGPMSATKDACKARPLNSVTVDVEDAADCRRRGKSIADEDMTLTVDDDKDAFQIASAEEWETPANADRKMPNKKGRIPVPKTKEDKELFEKCSLTQLKKLIKGEVQWLGFIKLAPSNQDDHCERETHEVAGTKPPGLQGHTNDQGGSVYVMLASEADQEAQLKPDPEMQAFLKEFLDVFQELPKGGIKDRAIKHHIPRIPDKLPKYPKQCYNLSDEHLAELKKKLKELLEKGFIIPSQAPIAAHVFFVPKRDGSLRMVVDYRPLNGITLKDDYSLPRIQDLINRLGKTTWFSKLNMQQGYYHVQVAEEDQWKTAFRTRYGTFQFTVMPFGLAGAPSTFQRPMQNIFLRELDEFVTVYLDDVLIYSQTRGEHIKHLRIVLERMRQEQIYLQLSKCELCKQKVRYLGYVISAEGVSADPERLETLRKWPEALVNKKQLRGFLGVVGYYRRLIPNFNKLAHCQDFAILPRSPLNSGLFSAEWRS